MCEPLYPASTGGAQGEFLYRDLVVQLEGGDSTHSVAKPLLLPVRRTVLAVLTLVEQIKDSLAVRSARSERDVRRFRAFEQLSFVANHELIVKTSLSQTLQGLDLIAAILKDGGSKRSRERLERPSKESPSPSETAGSRSAVRAKRALKFDPARLVLAIHEHRHLTVDVMKYFGVEQESTISRWRHGKLDMNPDRAAKYDEYVKILDQEPSK